MSLEQYNKVFDLILDFGNSQFLKGVYLADDSKVLYDNSCKRSSEILRELTAVLSEV